MQCFIDTHTFLWFVLDSPKLSETAGALLEDEDTEAFLSIASIWGLAIKYSLGRLQLAGDFGAVVNHLLEEAQVTLVPLTIEQCQIISQLPFHHRDPFDRMIVAQAISKRAPLISADQTLSLYDIERVW